MVLLKFLQGATTLIWHICFRSDLLLLLHKWNCLTGSKYFSSTSDWINWIIKLWLHRANIFILSVLTAVVQIWGTGQFGGASLSFLPLAVCYCAAYIPSLSGPHCRSAPSLSAAYWATPPGRLPGATHRFTPTLLSCFLSFLISFFSGRLPRQHWSHSRYQFSYSPECFPGSMHVRP